MSTTHYSRTELTQKTDVKTKVCMIYLSAQNTSAHITFLNEANDHILTWPALQGDKTCL